MASPKSDEKASTAKGKLLFLGGSCENLLEITRVQWCCRERSKCH